jgi:hypothetical protein
MPPMPACIAAVIGLFSGAIAVVPGFSKVPYVSLNTELRRALTDRGIAEPLLAQGAEASPSTLQAVTRVMRDEHARWMNVTQSQNLKF